MHAELGAEFRKRLGSRVTVVLVEEVRAPSQSLKMVAVKKTRTPN
jgi:hypothetical protein